MVAVTIDVQRSGVYRCHRYTLVVDSSITQHPELGLSIGPEEG